MGENFCELVKKKKIYRENFRRLLTDATKRHHAPNFTEKTFLNSHKAAKSTKVFFLESFLLYTVCFLFSLDWAYYQWTGIGDEGATALASPRVIKNFKTLK